MIKIIVFILVSSILIVYLRNINSEFALLATIITGISLIIFSLDYLTETFSIIYKLIELSKVDKELFVIILKITTIGYLVEFTADTISDFGLKSISDKLIFIGKIIILSVSLPVIYAIINLLIGLMQ